MWPEYIAYAVKKKNPEKPIKKRLSPPPWCPPRRRWWCCLHWLSQPRLGETCWLITMQGVECGSSRDSATFFLALQQLSSYTSCCVGPAIIRGLFREERVQNNSVPVEAGRRWRRRRCSCSILPVPCLSCQCRSDMMGYDAGLAGGH